MVRTYFFLFVTLFFFHGCSSDDEPSTPDDESSAPEFYLSTATSPDNGGTISPSSGTYENGKTVELLAQANSIYEFIGWQGDISGSENPITVTMNSDLEVEALFELKLSELTFVPDDGFEQALIELGYDDFLDDYVFTESISELTSLDLSRKDISDMTGIEDFINLVL